MEVLQFVWLILPFLSIAAITAKAPTILVTVLLALTPLAAIVTQLIIYANRKK